MYFGTCGGFVRWIYVGNTACGRQTLLDLDVRVRAKACARERKLGIELAVARSPRGEIQLRRSAGNKNFEEWELEK